jgi:hypothetical protein
MLDKDFSKQSQHTLLHSACRARRYIRVGATTEGGAGCVDDTGAAVIVGGAVCGGFGGALILDLLLRDLEDFLDLDDGDLGSFFLASLLLLLLFGATGDLDFFDFE